MVWCIVVIKEDVFILFIGVYCYRVIFSNLGLVVENRGNIWKGSLNFIWFCKLGYSIVWLMGKVSYSLGMDYVVGVERRLRIKWIEEVIFLREERIKRREREMEVFF